MPVTFWSSSIDEIIDLIEAKEFQQKEQLKIEALTKSVQAAQIVEGIARILGDKKLQSREIWDYYPGLFDEEKKSAEEARKKRELELYQAKFNDFALRHNRKFEKGDDPQ